MATTLDKEKILDVGRAAFAKHGFRKASLSDIARPLGVAKTALYYYFPGGKWELIQAVMQREEDAVLGEMSRAIEKQNDPREKFRALVMAKLTHVHRLRDLLDVSRDIGEELARIHDAHVTAFHEAEARMIQNILRKGQAQGLFRKTSPLRLAGNLKMIIHYLELPLVFITSPDEMKREADSLIDILLYGIVNPKQNIEKRGSKR